MNYKNSSDFNIRYLSNDTLKNLNFKIYQLSDNITCSYNLIEYSKNVKYIDSNAKLAYKHQFISTTLNYLNNFLILEKKVILNSQDLAFMSNMLITKSITSAPGINLLNIATNSFEYINCSVIGDKKLLGHIGKQYMTKTIPLLS